MTPIPFRPTFWNIPFAGQILIYFLGIAAVCVCVCGIVKAVKRIRQGAPHEAGGAAGVRLRRLWLEAFAHTRIARTVSGKAHFALFWGFILLFLGTALATLDWDVTRPILGMRFLGGGFYLAYKLILDIAGAAVLVALAVAAVVRWVGRAPGLDTSPKFAVIMGLLALIVATGFFLEALRLAAQQSPWAAWSPVGNFLASAFFAGVPASALALAHTVLWWVHGLVSLAFVAAVPLGFFSHIFSAPWNIYEQKLEPAGAAPKIENIEEQQTFGVSKASQFTWKERLDFAACTECARCSAVCPARRMDTPLDPKNLVGKLRRAMKDGREELEGVVSHEELFACTTCGACLEVCPARINIPDTVMRLRTHYALEEGKFPPGVQNALENAMSVGNPWGMDPGSRFDWAEGLDLPFAEPGAEVEVLYWVGCAACYDRRSQRIAKAMVKILRAAGVNFAVMAEERCHGDFARRLGEEYLFQTAAAENIANLSQYSFGKILCACPHCFNTLKNEYPQFEGGVFEVVPHTEFILGLIREGRLKIAKGKPLDAVFHDPCYLSRYNGHAQGPRDVLKLAGVRLSEPENSGKSSLCCGAGGGQFWSDGSASQRINVTRYGDLRRKAATVATACPFCGSMMESARSSAKDDEAKILDIAEIVASRI